VYEGGQAMYSNFQSLGAAALKAAAAEEEVTVQSVNKFADRKRLFPND